MKPRKLSKRPTNQDVAALAGVSATTVSFVINNKSGGNVRISEETRKKVWDAVERLKYRPMSAARTLRTKRSNLLALVIPYIETPFQPQFAVAVQREAEKNGLDVFIYSTRNELQQEKNFLEGLIARRVDGVIIHSHRLSSEDIDPFVDAGIAVVVHGSSPVHPFIDNIMLDETRAAAEIVTFLIEQGHRRIGMISGPTSTWGGRLRQEGYLQALQACGLPLEDGLIQETDFYEQGAGRVAMQKLLALPEPPTAVFAASDLLAVDGLLYVVDSGCKVPADVAIVGFDNTRESTMVRPRLTTVHKDVNLLASAALQLLVERINSPEPLPARQKILEHRIIYRESA